MPYLDKTHIEYNKLFAMKVFYIISSADSVHSNFPSPRKSMEFFRGPAAPGVDEEFIAIIESTSMTMYKGDRCGSVRKLMAYSFLKPISCIGILYFTYSLTGHHAISAYTNDYFEHAGPQALSYGTDSVILGSVECILTFLAPLILLRLSKKKLFVTCGFVSSTGFILGDVVAIIIQF